MQVTHLVDGEWHEDPTATYYGCDERHEHDQRGDGPRHREAPLEEGHDRQEDVRQDSRPDERSHDVTRAIDDV